MSESSKKSASRVVGKVVRDNEIGARKGLIEELFYDFHRSRIQVYWINFVRGIFFGLGSVLGGTLLIALILWVLSLLGNVFPPLDVMFDAVSSSIEQPSSE